LEEKSAILKKVKVDLTHPGEAGSGPLTLIDEAVAAAKRAAHSCRDRRAREHLEYALALLRESWVAEDGQQARGAGKVIEDVRWALNLFATAVFAAEEKEEAN
jgi:hypothetical protein